MATKQDQPRPNFEHTDDGLSFDNTQYADHDIRGTNNLGYNPDFLTEARLGTEAQPPQNLREGVTLLPFGRGICGRN